MKNVINKTSVKYVIISYFFQKNIEMQVHIADL